MGNLKLRWFVQVANTASGRCLWSNMCAYTGLKKKPCIFTTLRMPEKIIFIISLGWSNWQHDLLSTMPITRVGQPDPAGRQADWSGHPRFGKWSNLRVWDFYWEYAGSGGVKNSSPGKPLRECCRLSRRLQHSLNKNPIPASWIIYQNMGDRSNQLAVLQNRAAWHEWLPLWTTQYVCNAFSFVLLKGDCFILRCMVKYPKKKVCFISWEWRICKCWWTVASTWIWYRASSRKSKVRNIGQRWMSTGNWYACTTTSGQPLTSIKPGEINYWEPCYRH